MNTPGTQFGAADLTTCDRELIHIPGSIQPHGVLLVVDRDGLRIEQTAGDTAMLIGIENAAALGTRVSTLFDDETGAFISAKLSTPTAFIAPIIRLGVLPVRSSLPLDLTLTAQARTVILELEPARRTQSHGGDPISHLKTLLSSLSQAATVAQSLEAAAVTLRETTGFDRAMVYQFQADGSGIVVAEEAVAGLERFLGLHYPASDIPQQARELYKRNWLRAIPRIDYEPAMLRPALNPRTGALIDMSHCSLRSVSPIHLEYLRNMGVTATLSLSVVCRGELWGMLVLHHYAARHVPADLRVACETFAQVFSLQIEAKAHTERSIFQRDARRARETMLAGLFDASDPGAALATPELCGYVRAGGAAVYREGRLHCIGVTPTDAQILELLTWLEPRLAAIHCSNCLAAEFPPAAAYATEASGLLAVRLAQGAEDCVLWFRPELTTTVRWAGDPTKPVTAGPHGGRLTPRGSFAEWLALARQQSAPWSEGEIEAAEGLRLGMLDAILRSVNLVRREREKAFKRQDLLLSELDHRGKNTLGKVHALILAVERDAPSAKAFSETLLNRIEKMAHSDNLLAEGRWVGTSLGKIIADEMAPFSAPLAPRFSTSGHDVLLTPIEALGLNLVLQELVSNACRYGALSTPTGLVAIDWRQTAEPQALEINWQEARGPTVADPLAFGIGMNLIRKTIQDELLGEVEFTAPAAGLRCAIRLPTDALTTR